MHTVEEEINAFNAIWDADPSTEGQLWPPTSPLRPLCVASAMAAMPMRCEAIVPAEVMTTSLGSIFVFIGLLLASMVFGRNIAGFLDSLDNIEGS